jgi:hypothetical protein
MTRPGFEPGPPQWESEAIAQTASWHADLGFWFTRRGNTARSSEISLNHTLCIPEGWKQTEESNRKEDDFHPLRKELRILIWFISGPNDPPPLFLSSVEDRPVSHL